MAAKIVVAWDQSTAACSISSVSQSNPVLNIREDRIAPIYLRWISIKDLGSFLAAVFHTYIGIDNLIKLIAIKAP